MKKLMPFYTFSYIYTIIYIVFYTMLFFLPFKNFLYTYNMIFISTGIAFGGILLLIWDAVLHGFIFKIYNVDYLIVFFIVSIISIIINYQFDFIGNFKCLLWMIIQVFLLAILSDDISRENHVKRLCLLLDIFVLLWSVGVLYALKQYIVQFSGYCEMLDNEHVQVKRIGFTDGRLFGMFEDPNYAAIASLFAIGFAFFCLFWAKRARIIHWYYIIVIILQICYVILSGSRTALIAFFAVAFFAVGFIAAANTKRNVFVKMTLFFCAGILGAGLLFGGYRMMRTGLAYVPTFFDGVIKQTEPTKVKEDLIKKSIDMKIDSLTVMTSEKEKENFNSEAISSENKTENVKRNGPIELNREDVKNKEDFSNNRFGIWSDYLKIFRSTPIWGASPRGYRQYAKEHFPDLYVSQRQYSVHNGYLLLFVGVGLIGGMTMVVWLIQSVVLILKYLIFHWHSRNNDYWMIFLLTLILLMYAIASVPLQGIFFCNTITDILFWLVFGYVRYLICIDDTQYNRKISKAEQFYKLLKNMYGCQRRVERTRVI